MDEIAQTVTDAFGVEFDTTGMPRGTYTEKCGINAERALHLMSLDRKDGHDLDNGEMDDLQEYLDSVKIAITAVEEAIIRHK